MTIDHMNRFFWQQKSYLAYSLGRIAMPLFAFVFAYNLAREKKISWNTYSKTSKRLLFFGLLATPAYIVMIKVTGITPLNIMFTFLVALSAIYLEGNDFRAAALLCVLIGGYGVEYGWAAIILCAAFYEYYKKPSLLVLGMLVAGYVLLYWVNGNNWGLMALPLILLASLINIPLPRWRYLFWIYYPLHLTLLFLMSLYLYRN